MSSSSREAEGLLYLLVGGPAMVMWGLAKLREKRLIENIATSKVRSAAIGLVELAGIARPRKVMKAPISQMDCCWWHCQVQELRSSGKKSHWVTIKQIGSVDLFYLQDNTGRVLINPLNADLRVLTIPSDLNSSTRTRMSPVLQMWGLDDMNWFGMSKRLRIVEQVIPDGAPLYVMGELMSLGDHVGDRRAKLMARLRAVKSDAKVMAAADLNKDGRVDADEWDTLRAQQEEAFYKEELARMASMPNEEALMVKEPLEDPFLIATKTEGDLLKSFFWLIPLALAGGIAMSGLGVWWGLASGWNPLIVVALVAGGCVVGLFLKQIKSWRT